MTAKLNQIIAIEKGIKSRVHSDTSDLYKQVQKATLFDGFVKTYVPKNDEDETLPSEKKRVQATVPDVLRDLSRHTTELMDVTARKDFTNCVASADVKVNGKTLIAKAPVSYLLFLEKQLTDLRTFVDNLPILDESENWTKDENSGLFKSDNIQTHRTKKVQKPIVLYNATVEHPAQTQMISEDVIVGYWNQVKQSGAMPKPEKQKLSQKVEVLLLAVKEAREEANMCEEVDVPSIGGAVF